MWQSCGFIGVIDLAFDTDQGLKPWRSLRLFALSLLSRFSENRGLQTEVRDMHV